MVDGLLGRSGRIALVGLLLGLTSGCVRGPDVSTSQLPLRRVVIYRNGVAYFERAGEVDEERVQFQLRQKNVGDFLATLAIVERGGSSVRAASFPVEIEDDEDDRPEIVRALDAWEAAEARRDPRKMREVSLELDGESHDLAVGYLAETPLWRPSYRLVVGDDGNADLQAWGIVQNQSGEDWTDVQISLVAGAPIAFESTLGEPVTPPRPVVTDTGEVINAVPDSLTTLHQAPAPPPEAEMVEHKAEPHVTAGSSAQHMKRSAPRPTSAPAPGEPARVADDAPMADAGGAYEESYATPEVAPSAPRDLSRLAQVQIQTGATRYDVPHTVTIPDQSATMVLLISQQVPGEAVYLFAPDYGVPESRKHPFRVARFTNSSAGLLERGPIAVFEKGAFLGQGMLDSLPTQAHATVPFALMREIGVESERQHDTRDARIYSIEASRLKIERDSTTLSTYTLRNGGAKSAKVLVRHPRIGGAELKNPPPGTEENVGEGHALVPVEVAAHGTAKLVVEERLPARSAVDWLSEDAALAVKSYLKDPQADADVARQLKAAYEIRDRVEAARDREQKLTREQDELERSTRETRLSLQSIEKNPQAADLRLKLTKRLDAGTSRLNEITKELIESRMERSEQEVRFRDAVRDIRLPARDRK